MTKFRAPRFGKPDANQSLIDAAAQRVGAEWIPVSQLPDAGCDRVYLFRGRQYIVEIKNPAQRWTYTESELRLQEKCARQGVDYHTVEVEENLLKAFGLL